MVVWATTAGASARQTRAANTDDGRTVMGLHLAVSTGHRPGVGAGRGMGAGTGVLALSRSTWVVKFSAISVSCRIRCSYTRNWAKHSTKVWGFAAAGWAAP